VPTDHLRLNCFWRHGNEKYRPSTGEEHSKGRRLVFEGHRSEIVCTEIKAKNRGWQEYAAKKRKNNGRPHPGSGREKEERTRSFSSRADSIMRVKCTRTTSLGEGDEETGRNPGWKLDNIIGADQTGECRI